MALSCAKDGSDWILGKMICRKGHEAVEQAVHGSGGFTIQMIL